MTNEVKELIISHEGVWFQWEKDTLDKELRKLAKGFNEKMRSIEASGLTGMSSYKKATVLINRNNLLKSGKTGKGSNFDKPRFREGYSSSSVRDKIDALEALTGLSKDIGFSKDSINDYKLKMFNRVRKGVSNIRADQVSKFIAFTESMTFKDLRRYFDSEQSFKLLEDVENEVNLFELFNMYARDNSGKEVDYHEFSQYVRKKADSLVYVDDVLFEEIEIDEEEDDDMEFDLGDILVFR